MKSFLVTVTAALASLTLAVDPAVDPATDSIVETVVTELTRWPPPPPPATTSTSSSSFVITVTTLPSTTPTTVVTSLTTSAPGKPTITPVACPTVTLTTRPAGCSAIRCPIPGCTYEQDMVIPCGCSLKTLLWVEGCQTACPEGCATRTSTLSQLCETGTASLALPSAV